MGPFSNLLILLQFCHVIFEHKALAKDVMEEHYKEDWRSLDLNLGSLREIYNIYSAPTKTSNATVN